ncbi:hypothetical protein R3P38DRAFT_2774891 [Favolaschia claudopus]|uniref:Uncharacterized protein n=1 Tax=Favolaschia claudopus TaxID=2862362 RepID=A0AAW0BUM9_9AGAR
MSTKSDGNLTPLTPIVADELLIQKVEDCKSKVAIAYTDMMAKKGVLDSLPAKQNTARRSAQTAYTAARRKHTQAEAALTEAEKELSLYQLNAQELDQRLQGVSAEQEEKQLDGEAAAEKKQLDDEAVMETKRIEDEAAAEKKRLEEKAAAEKKRLEEEAAEKKRLADEAAAAVEKKRLDDEAVVAAEKKRLEEEEEAEKKRRDEKRPNTQSKPARQKTKSTTKSSAKAGDATASKKETKLPGKRTLTDVAAEKSDASDGPNDKRKRKKKRPDAKQAHTNLKQTHTELLSTLETQNNLLENAVYQLNNTQMSSEKFDGLTETKKKTEAAIAETREALQKVEAELKDPSWEGRDSSESDDDFSDLDASQKIDVETKWRKSFSPNAVNWLRTFPNGPEAWRTEMEKNAEAHIVKYLAVKPGEYQIPADIRRLLRKIPELARQCATSSRALALHILTTGKTQCRFHEEKRSTLAAKEVDGPTKIVGVAYAKVDGKRIEKQEGIMHCGCSETEALWEFMWFKTWTVKSAHQKITREETMGTDTLLSRHRAFFAQAYTVGTLLDINDYYLPGLAPGTPEYDSALRWKQVGRIIGVLNRMGGTAQGELVLARKEIDPLGREMLVPVFDSA